MDSIVSDPPYELGFMGKGWDKTGIANSVEMWGECLRVLKPGGHLLSFGGTRTYHRMACAIEDAGFEVRDMLEWIYFSGFPKSLNIGKAVDKLQGNEREEYLAPIAYADSDCWGIPNKNSVGNNWGVVGADNSGKGKGIGTKGMTPRTKGNSEWEGFGTALKPAHEPIILARRPLSEKTIVENVLKWGTGAIDIDRCRIPTSEITGRNLYDNPSWKNTSKAGQGSVNDNWKQGRWPANIICSDDALNDGEITKSGLLAKHHKVKGSGGQSGFLGISMKRDSFYKDYGNDSGSKSRYFDIECWAEKYGLLQFPKASKRERNEGCEGLEERKFIDKVQKKHQKCNVCGCEHLTSYGLKCGHNDYSWFEHENKQTSANNKGGSIKNHHPCVKPVHLLAWLVRLVSKEGDTVLDPFMGSGTTGVACKKLSRNFIGIELDPEYFAIAEKRINGSQEELL